MTYKWEAGGSVWLEDDQGRFALAASAGLGDIDWQEAQGRLQDVAQLWDASLPGACRHASIYPEGFDVSDYAWLPATVPRRGEVALVPTAQGLFRLWINPVNHSYRTEPVFRAALVGAPGMLRQRIACLLLESGRGLLVERAPRWRRS